MLPPGRMTGPPLLFSGIAPGAGSGFGRGTMNLLLFICTGNYYRSRFAEAVFNHHAKQRGLPWRAFSRGLAIHPADCRALTMRGRRE